MMRTKLGTGESRPRMTDRPQVAASFRDPSGFVFERDGAIYRQINRHYAQEYAHLTTSGLYERLVEEGKLLSHEEINLDPPQKETAFKIIRPDPLEFISYPYEWSFSQLKDAALLTLEIQKEALASGMSLKDSSAYNIQFRVADAKPVLIDTLSFEISAVDKPWVAYRQYCQHFLAPLALMVHRDIRLGQLLRVHIDGVPLDLASRLLPKRTLLDFGLLSHIHLHAKAQQRYAAREIDPETLNRTLSRNQVLGLIDSLARTTRKLNWDIGGTEWEDYYLDTNYSVEASADKSDAVERFIQQVEPESVWDMGANTGLYSRIASRRDIPTLAFDVDAGAVEGNYLLIKENREKNLLPLLMDLTNPSPDIGWHNRERRNLIGRGRADLILALALIHHLAISNNVPLDMIAEYLAALAPWLVVEFVPKSDSQIQRLLASRRDIFPNYTTQGFETAFGSHYQVVSQHPIKDSDRVLYLMKRRKL